METTSSLIQLIEESIRKNWNLDAMTDYKGATLQYKDVARKIEKMHILFEHAGIKKGELNSSYKCNGIHINNLFKFFVWCEVSKSFTRSII